jgi:hypothetical protein
VAAAVARAALWVLAAVAAGVVVFEGLDLIGSSPVFTAALPVAASLPSISPLVAGAVAAGVARPGAVLSLVTAAACVWARIGVDRELGVLQGAHPPAEAGVVLVGFGFSWMLSALVGGAVVVLSRWILRRRAHSSRQGSSPRVM